jgi:hypothetical protein
LSGLFTDVCLLLKVNEPKRVVFENGRRADHVLRENVQLMLAGRTEPKHPNLRFYLACFGCWRIFRRLAEDVGDSGRNGAKALHTCRGRIQCVDVGSAVVEAFSIFEIKSNGEVSVPARESEAAWCVRILASNLGPIVELIRRCEDRRGGNDRFN